ncbi:FMN-binding domain-containing protein [Acetitomaculum ruminis DSM 5522]|uniref:FMN-binding domain-containing protein n=1 Tax=Acetitomaculum ruminis DSM 5522 TaxID=1120918 RepID=A0A1I0YKQ0_9FIRM|nr:FMN-binding protein [Acetitomaculum ruminis]SFB12743.1 FMN-binding domain-containing protein [Acetitomaculum ruminis DSM 5522]
MKSFFIKLSNLILVVVILLVYNNIVGGYYANYEVKAAKIKAKIEAIEKENSSKSSYTDGNYQGKGSGFGGDIVVEVVIKKGKISKINVLSHDNEDDAYYNMASDVISDIYEAQSADVDTISGATFSSTGIIEATKDALSKAV